MRAAWDDTLFEAFVFLNSTAILVHFFDPPALEAFEIHLQDVGLTLLSCGSRLESSCWTLHQGQGQGKGQGQGQALMANACFSVCRTPPQTCGSYAQSSPLPNGVLLVCFFQKQQQHNAFHFQPEVCEKSLAELTVFLKNKFDAFQLWLVMCVIADCVRSRVECNCYE